MNNADSQELYKFGNAAAQWWDLNGDYESLHAINPLRMQFIQEQVDLSQKTVLDVGCGGGILSESLAKAGAVVTGLDLSEPLLQVAREHAQKQNLSIHYVCQSVEAMAEAHPAQFDCITCMEMLEHVPDPISVVSACSRLVKPGGYVFFSTLNRNVTSYFSAILGAEYLLGLLPKGTHDFSKFIRPSELDEWAYQNALDLLALRGISYFPVLKKYVLSDQISINYLAFCQKKSALHSDPQPLSLPAK